MLALAAAALLAASPCPDPSAGETAADCPWAGIARDIDAGRPSAFPSRLARDMAADARRPGMLSLWGRTRDFDEFAKGVIVSSSVVAALAERLPLPCTAGADGECHAGLLHTYGYLFSTLKTPFGFKRKRWVDGAVEAGFGLPAGALGPTPPSGTLLGNAAQFFGRIAFRDEPDALAALDRDGGPRALRRYPFKGLSVRRLLETVETPAGRVTVRSDAVAMPRSAGSLLVYSVLLSSAGAATPRLYTAFPVDAAFVEKLFADPDGPATVRARYNAVIPGLESPRPGMRSVELPRPPGR